MALDYMNRIAMQPNHSRIAYRGFTLIELLVVIGIIGILAGLLMPVLSRSKQKVTEVHCLSNVRELAIAGTLYSQDFDKTLAYTDELWRPKAGDIWLALLIGNYAHVDALRLCPKAAQMAPNTSWYAKDMNSAWIFKSMIDPTKFYTGSYALNGWLYTGLSDPSGWYYKKFSSVANAAKTPFFCDAIWADVWPDEKSGPAVDLTRGAITPDIGRITLARHGVSSVAIPKALIGNQPLLGAINISFLDGHAEFVSLERLWSLSWHQNWVIPSVRPPAVGLPPPWPAH